MNETPLLDELEQVIVRTLGAKADQVVVEDDVFRPDESAPILLRRRSSAGVTARRWSTRRIVAVAAAVVVVIVGATTILGIPTRHESEVTDTTTDPDQVVALVPDAV